MLTLSLLVFNLFLSLSYRKHFSSADYEISDDSLHSSPNNFDKDFHMRCNNTLFAVEDIYLTSTLRKLLTPDMRMHWCHPKMPLKVHVMLDDDDDAAAVEFAAYNHTIVGGSNLPSTIRFKLMTGNIRLKRSPQSLIDKTSFIWNETHYIQGEGYFSKPKAEDLAQSCDEFSEGGTYLFFANFFYDNFPRFLLEHIPTLLFLYKLSQSGALGHEYAHAKVLIPYGNVTVSTIAFIAGDNTSTADRFEYYNVNKLHCYRNAKMLTTHYQWHGLLRGLDIAYTTHSPVSISVARYVVNEFRGSPRRCSLRTIVYYSRAGSGVHHNRRVGNEKEAKDTIKLLMAEHNLTMPLVIFDGKGSFEEQFDVFRCADVIIGPHGAGLGNALWSHMSPNCLNAVHVVEAVCSIRSRSVQGGCPFQKNFYLLLSGLPWVHYHNIFFTEQSSSNTTYFPIEALYVLLHNIFVMKYGRKMNGILQHDSYRMIHNDRVLHSKHFSTFYRA